MNHTLSRLFGPFLISLLILIASGCGGTRRPVVYYNLSQMEAAPRKDVPTQNKHLAIGVGPIELPEALNRSQIAARLDNQRLTYSDYNRWSGSLRDEFATTLMEDIARQLPEQTPTALFPWASHFQPSHRLVVSISQFDGQLGGEVILAARWAITNGDGKESLLTRKSTIRVKAAGSQYQDLVSAQSQAVAELSTEIATALSTL